MSKASLSFLQDEAWSGFTNGVHLRVSSKSCATFGYSHFIYIFDRERSAVCTYRTPVPQNVNALLSPSAPVSIRIFLFLWLYPGGIYSLNEPAFFLGFPQGFRLCHIHITALNFSIQFSPIPRNSWSICIKVTRSSLQDEKAKEVKMRIKRKHAGWTCISHPQKRLLPLYIPIIFLVCTIWVPNYKTLNMPSQHQLLFEDH